MYLYIYLFVGLTQHLPFSLRQSISKGSDEEMQPRTTNLTLSLSSEINKPGKI